MSENQQIKFELGKSLTFADAAEVCPDDIGCNTRCSNSYLPHKYHNIAKTNPRSAWLQFAKDGCHINGAPNTKGIEDIFHDTHYTSAVYTGAFPFRDNSMYERTHSANTSVNKLMPHSNHSFYSYLYSPNFKSIAKSPDGSIGIATAYPTQDSASKAAMASCHRGSDTFCREIYRGDTSTDSVDNFRTTVPIKNTVFIESADSAYVYKKNAREATFGHIGQNATPMRDLADMRITFENPSPNVLFASRADQFEKGSYDDAGSVELILSHLNTHTHHLKMPPFGVLVGTMPNGRRALLAVRVLTYDLPEGANILEMDIRPISQQEHVEDLLAGLVPHLHPVQDKIEIMNFYKFKSLELKDVALFFR